MPVMRLFLPLLLVLCAAQAPHATAAEPAVPDQYWFLIHDRAVLAELKLTPTQRSALLKVTDELDLRFMPLRGSSPEQAAQGLRSLAEEAQTRLKTVLKPEQQKRLGEIAMCVQGTSALVRPDVAQKMAYAAGQKAKVEEIISETKEKLAVLDKEAQSGKSADKERKEIQTQEQTRLLEVLSKPQQAKWRELVGATFDASRLGKGAFKAPELAVTKEWVNSKPLSLSQLHGQVVALHFYAFG